MRQHRGEILRQTAAVEAGAAYRKELFIEKLDCPQAFPVTRSEPDRDVDAVGLEIRQRLTGLDVQVDARKAGLKARTGAAPASAPPSPAAG